MVRIRDRPSPKSMSENERKRKGKEFNCHHGLKRATVGNDGKDSVGKNTDDSRRKRHNGNRQQKNHGHTISKTNGNGIREDREGVLQWYSTEPYVPLAAEEDMLNVILRWGEKERGMLRNQPPFRLIAIQKRCKRNGMNISQACSLRRHHMCLLNPFKSKEALRLGQTADIRDSAELFEIAVATFLRRQNIRFYSEEEQKKHFKRKNPGELIKATPDFKMKEPVILKLFFVTHNQKGKKQKRFHSERTIHWMEAKMFYGASTIPHDDKSAVGNILSKMRKYVELYGEGAIVFMQGCGDRLASELAEIGVTALSCTGIDINLSPVKRHQRTWCADQNGNILP